MCDTLRITCNHLESTMTDNSKTHFGYQEVLVSEKEKLVGDVFNRVAHRYNLMNDVMSLGVHRLWKRVAVDMCALRQNQTVLDLAGGTGDLTKQISQRVGEAGSVVLADINAAMLQSGRAALIDAGIVGNVYYVQANAEALPFPDNHFHCITIAFGLRNVTDKDAALRSMYRVLKPGGRLVVLEFSKPTQPLLGALYDAYSFTCLPFMGKWIAHDEESYRYLAESIRKHPDQETQKTMMLDAGFSRVDVTNLSGGIVAIHRGMKHPC